MAAVPAGMESSSDSDEGDIVHFHEISNNLTANTDDLKVNSTTSFEERNPNIISFSNGNVKTNFSTTSVAKRNLVNSQKSNLHKPRRCVDFKTKQLLDDFRFAVMQGNFEIVSSVIKNGMFVDSVLNAGWTALMYASSCGHHEIVKFLLDENADPNFQKDLFTSLMAACASSHDEQNLLKCCQYLLEYGASINVQERHLTSPLMFAAKEGHIEIVKELLKHDVQLDSHDNKGRTALAWAASKGFGQIVRLLLHSGADPNKVTFGGLSPAELAYDEGYKEIASLLQKGSQLRGENESNRDLNLADNVPNLSAKEYSHIPARSLQNNQKPLDETKCYVKQGDLELLLTGIGFPELIHTFKENHLTFQDVLMLTDDDLEKVGVTCFGARKKILDATKGAHKKEWQTSSLPDLSLHISCPDAVAMAANISKHLQYITSSVVYIRQQIQAQPRILELGQDSSNIHDLIDETKDSLKHALLLSEELRFLKLHLDKVQDNVEYIPADLIVETVPQSKTTNKKFVYGAVLTIMTITVAGILLKKSKPLIDLITSIPLLDNFFSFMK